MNIGSQPVNSEQPIVTWIILLEPKIKQWENPLTILKINRQIITAHTY
jgi:hypothetical protein